MNELYLAYQDRDDVAFFIVYTREPHPRQPLGPAYNFWRIRQSRTYAERVQYAKAAREKHGIDMPILVDTMDGAVQNGYGGLPNSVTIIDPEGNVNARKAWNDALFVELTLRDLVEDPPVVEHAGALGSCRECHEDEVVAIANEHPMTDCSICHYHFVDRSMLKKPGAKAREHADNPDKPIGKKMTCTAACHSPDFLPPEHEVGGLDFDHPRHIERGASCIDCHGKNAPHAFHDLSEDVCLNCHDDTGSVGLNAEAEKRFTKSGWKKMFERKKEN